MRPDAAGAGQEILTKRGVMAPAQAQHVMHHQHLTAAVGTGTDADGRDVQRR